MRVEFTRAQGRLTLRDGVVRGPLLGGTIDGVVDYGRDEVHLRGTLVPLYGPNNLLGQIPVVGLFLGGDKEGLFGVTYEVVGRPGIAGPAHQSDFGAGAGPVAQGVRIPLDHALCPAAGCRRQRHELLRQQQAGANGINASH